MKIFFSAGEPSGDIHGANLIRALRSLQPEVRCVGFGGPKMKEAGLEQHFDLTSLAVMWVGEVLANLRKFFALADDAEAYFHAEHPDAVVLIDYPGFNWHIAKRAKRLGIPVFYYSPPQVWSWKQGRVKKLRRLTDLIFSGLPFEARWLREHGCRVECTGHPFFDEVRNHPQNTEFMAKLSENRPVVGLLPGSRTGEVHRNFPIFWNTAVRICRVLPNVRFAVAAFREEHAQWIRDFVETQKGLETQNRSETQDRSGFPQLEIFVQHTPEIIQASDCCLSVSGSVSLELLHHAKPTVIAYHVSRFGWFAQWLCRRVRFITLVNLLAVENPFRSFNPEFRPDSQDARDAIFPEYLTCRDRSEWIAGDLLRWLQNEEERMECVHRLEALRREFGQDGAARNAAEKILTFLD